MNCFVSRSKDFLSFLLNENPLKLYTIRKNRLLFSSVWYYRSWQEWGELINFISYDHIRCIISQRKFIRGNVGEDFTASSSLEIDFPCIIYIHVHNACSAICAKIESVRCTWEIYSAKFPRNELRRSPFTQARLPPPIVIVYRIYY